MKKNIVLIGMPGSGKTTIGKVLHEKLKFNFVDIDQYIEEKSRKVISEIFEQGEEYFRSLERQAVDELSKKHSLVISTGGGVVKNHSNIEKLKEKGIIIFIDRPLEDIAKDVEVSNRPLLKNGMDALYKLFNERYNLYKEYCDFHIKNDKGVDHTVKIIMEMIS